MYLLSVLFLPSDITVLSHKDLLDFFLLLSLSVAMLGLVDLLYHIWRDDRSRRVGHLSCVLKIGCSAPPPVTTWQCVFQVHL